MPLTCILYLAHSVAKFLVVLTSFSSCGTYSVTTQLAHHRANINNLSTYVTPWGWQTVVLNEEPVDEHP